MIECLKTNGCVATAGGVVIERIKTNRRVVDADAEAEERIFTFGRVGVGIASVRFWAKLRSSHLRKRYAA